MPHKRELLLQLSQINIDAQPPESHNPLIIADFPFVFQASCHPIQQSYKHTIAVVVMQ